MTARRLGWPRWSNLQLRTKALIIVAVSVLPLVFLWTIIGITLLRSPATGTAARARGMQIALPKLVAAVFDADAASLDRRGATAPEVSTRFDHAVGRAQGLLTDLDRLATDDHLQSIFEELQKTAAAALAAFSARLSAPSAAADGATGDAMTAALTARVRDLADAMAARQTELTDRRTAASSQWNRWFIWLFLATSVICVAGGFVAAMRLGRHTRDRVRVLSLNAGRLARGEPLETMPPGRDEIARLGTHLDEAAQLLQARAAALQQHVAEQRETLGQLDDANRALWQRSVELETANRELEAFSYSVSHDLRAPLRAIDGFSRALQEDYGQVLDPPAHRLLQRVRAAATRMGTLIDALLNLARLTRMDLHREPLDLSAIAASIVTERSGRSTDHTDQVTVMPGLKANADSRMVRIVLQNLLDNAWKYTSKTPNPQIEVGRSSENGTTRFHVRDNGAGFDMTHAGKLFGAFQRLHAERDFEGTGIGLATVQRIVHRHGGSIWAESAVGAGATFYFTLEPAQESAGHGETIDPAR